MQDAHVLKHTFTCMVKITLFGQQQQQQQHLFSCDLVGVKVYSICHWQAIRLGVKPGERWFNLPNAKALLGSSLNISVEARS